jgi:hypothetical protein
MTIYREMGNEDFSLLEYLYNQLKWEQLATKKGIHRIIGTAEELRNLDQTLIDTASDIGRLNFKSNFEMDLDELTRKIDWYDAILLERIQQARHLRPDQVHVSQEWISMALSRIEGIP